MPIIQTITPLPPAGHRGAEVRDVFVEKQEQFQDALQGVTVEELNVLATEINDESALMQQRVIDTSASEDAAKVSEDAAKASEDASKASEDAAKASEDASKVSEDAAKVSEDAAEASAVGSEASYQNALAIMDDFQGTAVWVQGSDYGIYMIVTDPVDFKTYKANVAITNSQVPPRSSGDWIDISTGGLATIKQTEFTATAGQTIFTMNYRPDYVEVYRQGMKLGLNEFDATSGTSIVLTVGATVGDLISVLDYGIFTVADVYTRSELSEVFQLDKVISREDITNMVYAGGTSGTKLSTISYTNNYTQELVYDGSDKLQFIDHKIGANYEAYTELIYVNGKLTQTPYTNTARI